jgi:hypothetical protein
VLHCQDSRFIAIPLALFVFIEMKVVTVAAVWYLGLCWWSVNPQAKLGMYSDTLGLSMDWTGVASE